MRASCRPCLCEGVPGAWCVSFSVIFLLAPCLLLPFDLFAACLWIPHRHCALLCPRMLLDPCIQSYLIRLFVCVSYCVRPCYTFVSCGGGLAVAVAVTEGATAAVQCNCIVCLLLMPATDVPH